MSAFQDMEEINAVGVEHCILSTDSGSAALPTPVECLRVFIYSLLDVGVSKSSIEVMVKKNPLSLLDLD
jgi:hypothetical protein